MNRSRLVVGLLALAMLTAGTRTTRAEFNAVSAFPNTIFAGVVTPVTFVADIPDNPRLIRTSVQLLQQNAAGGFVAIASMRDDGLGGDAIANDNRFTAVVNLSGAEAGTPLILRASAGYTGSIRRDQSSNVTVDVVARVDLEVNAGQSELTVLAGSSTSTAFTLNASNGAGGSGLVAVQQTVTPDDGGLGIVTDLPPAGFPTTQPLQAFLVQNTFTGIDPGEYTVTLNATFTAAGLTDTASAMITVRVLPASGIGTLTLSAYPTGLKAETAVQALFGASYEAGVALPASVELREVTEAGVPVTALGAMLDDGVLPDLGATDKIYSAQHALTGGAPGSVRYFQAIANFDGGLTAESPILRLLSVPFELSFAPVPPTSVVTDPRLPQPMACDQIIVSMIAGTPVSTVLAIAGSVGAAVIGAEPGIDTYQFQVPCSADLVWSVIEQLNDDPAVLSAQPNALADVAEFTPNDPRYASQYAAPLTRLDEAWTIARGMGVTVAVLDTGVDYNHEDLAGRVVLGKDYVNGDDDPRDDHSHGTHVAGIVAARGNNSKGTAGAAWDARILAIKVCGGRSGVPGVGLIIGCPNAAVISGVLAAIPSARILNLSLGGPKSTWESLLNSVGLKTSYEKAFDTAAAAGRLVVVAAGNSNTSSLFLPCSYAATLCVGNSTSADLRYAHPASGSNFGAQVDIAAPGTGILAPVPSFDSMSGYATKTGTSMASPLVAGIAALVWANNPGWTPGQVRDRLLKTAKPLPGQQIGPRVDAFDAVFNGSFEHDLTGWKVVGTGSAVESLGPIAPTKDKKFGMASTGPDAAVAESELYQEFTIRSDITSLKLSFSYAMVTEEYPEWVNRGYNDDLVITLEKPDGSVQEVAIETVDGSAFTLIGGINFPGGDATVGWTGWKQVNSVTIPVSPGGGTYRLRVRDRGDGIYDTNGLIDNIRFR